MKNSCKNINNIYNEFKIILNEKYLCIDKHEYLKASLIREGSSMNAFIGANQNTLKLYCFNIVSKKAKSIIEKLNLK